MQCIVGKVCKPQHTTSDLWALAYAIFSTWYAIHSFHHQSHELIFILQNPANHCQFHEDFQTPDIWVSSSWLLASILQISVVLYFKNSLFIYFFYFPPFLIILCASSGTDSIPFIFLATDVSRTQQVLKKKNAERTIRGRKYAKRVLQVHREGQTDPAEEPPLRNVVKYPCRLSNT